MDEKRKTELPTLLLTQSPPVPALIAAAGDRASQRFLEYFAAQIRNRGTRAAYARAVARFCFWCEDYGLSLERVKPIVVAAYVEQLTTRLGAPTVKLHLAAIRMLFDHLVTGPSSNRTRRRASAGRGTS